MKRSQINVTKTYLPNKSKFLKYVDKIYETAWLTNNGPLVREFEERLAEYLNVENVVAVGNGTLALQIAYKLLDLSGEIITTPFSFVATTSSIVWENFTPVFSDINRDTLNIDTALIKEKITPLTSAIVPVHVYGNPCNIEEIDKIAKEHNLKVIYDAAHAFGVKYNKQSVFNFGNISTCSFHATKIFHTIEGGAIFTNNKEIALQTKRIINFGYENWKIKELGINAKMNEFEAAMGLAVLDEIDNILSLREERWSYYYKGLKDYIQLPLFNTGATQNFSYFPIILPNEEIVLNILDKLGEENIFPRRYFYPSLNTLEYIDKPVSCPVSEDISRRVITLPLFHDLDTDIMDIITETIKEAVR